ncbi:MAG: M48 family metallopeptidase [Silicimonas sp.]|nr:M48 family metallopeptidase [Silicimonas sp.]
MVVELRRSPRARRLSLRVSTLDGRVTLTVPSGVSEREARAFASEKADWIAQNLKRQTAPVLVVHGAELPVEGVVRRIVSGTGRAARLLPETITAPPERAGVKVAVLLKSLARDRLASAVDRYGSAIGRRATAIKLRDTRSRWGSCSQGGNLMFSWRLILAPPDVLDYVAAHEVAHLAHMNHSPAFWGAVAEICPTYEGPRAWLRREGASLHRYRFDAD